jgi:hypothetical protein
MFWLTDAEHPCPMPECVSVLSVDPDWTDRQVGRVIWDSGWYVEPGVGLVCPRHLPPKT